MRLMPRSAAQHDPEESPLSPAPELDLCSRPQLRRHPITTACTILAVIALGVTLAKVSGPFSAEARRALHGSQHVSTAPPFADACQSALKPAQPGAYCPIRGL
jgi:hypothetical protein